MKKQSDVQGFTMKCSNFVQCPVCYGCRAYASNEQACMICSLDKKKNICNIDLHRPELISKLITKNNLVIKERATFENEI